MFIKAIVLSALRLMVLCGGCLVLSGIAALLRPRFYPNGLNGNLVFFILMIILMIGIFIIVTWVAVPIRNWSEEYLEGQRRQLSDFND